MIGLHTPIPTVGLVREISWPIRCRDVLLDCPLVTVELAPQMKTASMKVRRINVRTQDSVPPSPQRVKREKRE